MTDTDLWLQWNPKLDRNVIEAILALYDATTLDGGTLGHASPMTSAERDRFASDLAYGLRAGDLHLLLARSAGRPVFMAMLVPDRLPNCRHRATLCKGTVHPDWRGRGMVTRAFRALIERAEQLGIEQFVLDVREGTRAQALWRRLGFVTFGVLEDYARVGNARHRGYYMVQSVDALRVRLGLGRAREGHDA